MKEKDLLAFESGDLRETGMGLLCHYGLQLEMFQRVNW